MDEYREALQRLVESIDKEDSPPSYYQTGGCVLCEIHKTACAYHAAKELLARPEPDIEDEVNEGVWQLKLEGDRQDAAVFEAFGYFEPAAAEKAREWRPIETAPRDGTEIEVKGLAQLYGPSSYALRFT